MYITSPQIAGLKNIYVTKTHKADEMEDEYVSLLLFCLQNVMFAVPIAFVLRPLRNPLAIRTRRPA